MHFVNAFIAERKLVVASRAREHSLHCIALAEIEGQQAKLFPGLRRQVDRQNALALTARGPLGGDRRRNGQDVGLWIGRLLRSCAPSSA